MAVCSPYASELVSTATPTAPSGVKKRSVDAPSSPPLWPQSGLPRVLRVPLLVR